MAEVGADGFGPLLRGDAAGGGTGERDGRVGTAADVAVHDAEHVHHVLRREAGFGDGPEERFVPAEPVGPVGGGDEGQLRQPGASAEHGAFGVGPVADFGAPAFVWSEAGGRGAHCRVDTGIDERFFAGEVAVGGHCCEAHLFRYRRHGEGGEAIGIGDGDGGPDDVFARHRRLGPAGGAGLLVPEQGTAFA